MRPATHLGGLTTTSSSATVSSAILKILKGVISAPPVRTSSLNSSRMKTSTNLARPNCFSAPVKWLSWRNYARRSCVIAELWFKSMSKVGFTGKGITRPKMPPRPYNDGSVGFWLDGGFGLWSEARQRLLFNDMSVGGSSETNFCTFGTEPRGFR